MYHETIYRIYSGECPRFNRQQDIRIEYQEILQSGGRKPGYKKMQCECPHISDCPHLDEWHRCPIFLAAPDDPNL